MSVIPRKTYDDIRCNIDWAEDNPKIILTFSSDIHPEHITEISRVIEKTITKWLNCKSCIQEECEKKLN